MYRLVIVAALLIVLYLMIRRAIQVWGQGGGSLTDPNQMVQDPVCKTFVPKSNAVSERIGGQTYFFCSPTCAKQFERQLSG